MTSIDPKIYWPTNLHNHNERTNNKRLEKKRQITRKGSKEVEVSDSAEFVEDVESSLTDTTVHELAESHRTKELQKVRDFDNDRRIQTRVDDLSSNEHIEEEESHGAGPKKKRRRFSGNTSTAFLTNLPASQYLSIQSIPSPKSPDQWFDHYRERLNPALNENDQTFGKIVNLIMDSYSKSEVHYIPTFCAVVRLIDKVSQFISKSKFAETTLRDLKSLGNFLVKKLLTKPFERTQNLSDFESHLKQFSRQNPSHIEVITLLQRVKEFQELN